MNQALLAVVMNSQQRKGKAQQLSYIRQLVSQATAPWISIGTWCYLLAENMWNALLIFASMLFGGHNSTEVAHGTESNRITGEAKIPDSPLMMLGRKGSLQEAESIVSFLEKEYSTKDAKTYLITGATSGIGLEAAKMLAIMNPLNRIIVVGRNKAKAEMAANEIASVYPEPQTFRENLIPMVCDHSSFSSVRSFASELSRKLDETWDPKKWPVNGVDVLCLNAATLQPNDVPPQFTEDNIEVTFQTNHLSPFLLVNLVHERLNAGGRVVVSSSGLHLYQKLLLEGLVDQRTGRARKRVETADGEDYNCKKSYAFSKLCNVALALELQERLRALDISVVSFSPGLIRQTGLFRHHRTSDESVKLPRDLMVNEKTVLWGAGALVYMATSNSVWQTGGQYWHDPDSETGPRAIYGKHFHPSDVSDSHISEAGRKKLWSLSCELTGISDGTIPDYSSRLASAD